MIERRKTKQVTVGGVKIGGGASASVQSMTNTKTQDVSATLKQITALKNAGCDIVRVAVPNIEAAKSFAEIKKSCPWPLVADIHFDYKLALICIDGGADKIRINPGNIGSEEGVREVAKAADSAGIPIRIGVNGGSLSRDILQKYGNTAEAMVQSALENVQMLNKYDFDNIIISLKSSNVEKTIESYILMSQKTDYPLHLGVTEAGTLVSGAVKSAMGIGGLLLRGIGDTIRVSLTDDPVREIEVAKEILIAAGLNETGVEVISCPSCGRCNIDLIGIANEVRDKTRHVKKKMTVAVMGCAVNGPGEAREADIGASGGDGVGIIFKKGELIRTIAQEDIVTELLKEIGE